MPARDRLRWLELLSYVHALVYHERDPSEQPALQEAIEASVATDEHRQGVTEMKRTIADELKAEGKKEGRVLGLQQALLTVLRKRFGELPGEVVGMVQATEDPAQLDDWLARSLSAAALEELTLRPRRRRANGGRR